MDSVASRGRVCECRCWRQRSSLAARRWLWRFRCSPTWFRAPAASWAPVSRADRGPGRCHRLGFTLEVTWGPDFILFTEDPFGGTQSGHMHLFFTFTGTHDGTEHLGDITFLDADGNPILDPAVGFDDLNPVAGVVAANYEIFGPSSFIHGFTLSLSDGSGVDSMQWTRATISPASPSQ